MENNTVYGKRRSAGTLKLIERLKTFSEEKDFVLGILSNTPDEEDRQILLHYIETEKDLTIEDIILYSLELGDIRARKDWQEKMSEPVKFIKITEEEYKRLKAEGKLN